ncbi:oligosaccharide flippase family protein [Rhodobacter sp. SGA-6-6]|uniref:lipopolysaccharide biosynthesis protein n=1 Tax=Rhodobacter sp. SGA-6-6 TaxID=2710882 RepID=UPI0013ED830B|nr:oligosaccharide flippase family protein [Rhodobacter sp. SGA-6-6]NGM44573.1 oligosaccharide flippase family protein [Rhodobacter sp. SGA-6-6]
MIERLRRHLPRGGLMHHAAVLTMGTLLGRGIAVLAMPFLTRIYTPDDFSALASYSAVLGILAVIACLRFEVAIPLPESDGTAVSLLVAALLGPIVIAAVAALVILLAGHQLAALFPRMASPAILWLLPPGVLLVGMFQAMQFWATRKKQFADVARTRVTQAVAGVSAMLALGLGGIGAAGLTFGHMVMQGAGALGLGIRTLRADPHLLRGVTRQGMFAAAREYRRFPLWSMPEALANVAGLQIPILLIAAFADTDEAGQLMLAMQVMVMPMALVGSSLGQVYLSRAPTEHREGRLAAFTLSIVRRLALFGAPPIAVLGLTAPWTFPLVFGENWARAGVIAAMMVPWIVAQFSWSPISTVVLITNQAKKFFFVAIVTLALRAGVVAFFLLTLGSENGTFALCLVNVCFYLLLLIVFTIIPQRRPASSSAQDF